MIDEKQTEKPLANGKTSEEFIVYSDFFVAARLGWRWIVGLIFFLIGVSIAWDASRPPLYEAKATIRVGWAYVGSNAVPIEPVRDLIVMAKEGVFLNPFFEDVGLKTEQEKNEFEKNIFIRIKAPATNVVEFKIISRSPENARGWLEKLVSMKVAEHERIIEDFVTHRQQLFAECSGGRIYDSSDKYAALSNLCLSQDMVFGNTVAPLVAKTIISQPVKVEEASVFPSLRFLIAASISGGLIFGAFIFFILMNYKKFKNTSSRKH